MNEYISSFTTGFAEVIRRALPLSLPGAETIAVYDGLVHYRYGGDPKNILRVDYFNNSFYVLRRYAGSALTFPKMAAKAAGGKLRPLVSKGTFRIRFSRENRFEKVDRSACAAVERAVCAASGMKPDRVNPQSEFWFIIRSENVGFFAELLQKRAATEKTLQKGELRPELAFLLCVYAGLTPPARLTVCDPFAGRGAIPLQLAARFQAEKLIAGDLDPACTEALRQNPALKKPGVQILTEDARALPSVPDGAVDLIVTDPPWSYYEQIDDITGFYAEMLRSFHRVLKPGGRAVVLTARKNELLAAAEAAGAVVSNQLNTLVNGKKAGVFTIGYTK